MNRGSTILVIMDSLKVDTEKPVDIPNFKEGITRFIRDALKLPVQVFISCGNDIYRKPFTGMWDLFMSEISPRVLKEVIYVSEKMGRDKDKSAVDYLFAKNNNMAYNTPEFFFYGVDENDIGKHLVPSFPPRDGIIAVLPLLIPEITQPLNREVIILVGYNGSGKSTFVEQYIAKAGFNIVDRRVLQQNTLQTFENYCQYLNDDTTICVDDDDNTDSSHRKYYEDIAAKHNIPCRYMCFLLPYDHRLHNIRYRFIFQKKYESEESTPDDKNNNFLTDIISKKEAVYHFVNFVPLWKNDPTYADYYKYVLL
jgi:bifunctional polynucleotide phosphatase/kinase